MKVEGLGVRITDLEVEGIVDISTDGEGCVAINFGNRIFRWSKSDTRKLRDALSVALGDGGDESPMTCECGWTDDPKKVRHFCPKTTPGLVAGHENLNLVTDKRNGKREK